MATKTIAWGAGSGNITLTYTGQGNGSVSVKSDANDLYEERVKNITIKTSKGSPQVTKTVTVKQKGKSLGWTTKDFDYTGGVQSIELPAGKYKLQCWGAQGGTSYGSSSGVGSKGGYSEGVLTLTETTTLYVFVGGKGANGPSTSLVNGGWNGGGASVGKSSYNSGGENGESYPASGGGSTDFCTVTSSMSYSSGRTNRSSESLLSRIIVAGGGAGGSCYNRAKEITSVVEEEVYIDTLNTTYWESQYAESLNMTQHWFKYPNNLVNGKTYKLKGTGGPDYRNTLLFYKNTSGNIVYKAIATSSFTLSDFASFERWEVRQNNDHMDTGYTGDLALYEIVPSTTTTTETSSGYSNKSQQGGGTSGKGQYPGTQTSADSGGEFGFGANQTRTDYRYCAGGGGGGWYGGGTGKSDTSTSYINYTGGGSGFVNTSANASSRPSGYTGLQLDSGTTTAGDTSHPSINGGTEIGHNGNGYARITVVDNGLPAGYTRVTYVEFTGKQYVDTGFIPSNTTKLWMDFEIPTPIVGNVYYGSRNSSYQKAFLFAYSSVSGKLRTQFGTQTLDHDASIKGRHEITHDKNDVTLDGVTKTHTDSIFTSPEPLFLGADNIGGTAYSKASFRIYGCQIYDDGVLVRDFVPVTNSEGTKGLFDLVTYSFYISASGTNLD